MPDEWVVEVRAELACGCYEGSVFVLDREPDPLTTLYGLGEFFNRSYHDVHGMCAESAGHAEGGSSLLTITSVVRPIREGDL